MKIEYRKYTGVHYAGLCKVVDFEDEHDGYISTHVVYRWWNNKWVETQECAPIVLHHGDKISESELMLELL